MSQVQVLVLVLVLELDLDLYENGRTLYIEKYEIQLAPFLKHDRSTANQCTKNSLYEKIRTCATDCPTKSIRLLIMYQY